MTKNINNKFSGKKPFLFSNKGKILPDNLEEGKRIINEFDKTEEIISINNIGKKTYIKTTEPIEDKECINRIYELKENNKLNKINQDYSTTGITEKYKFSKN